MSDTIGMRQASKDGIPTRRSTICGERRQCITSGSGREADASARLDAVVLSIARLIGRRMAREDFEKAMRAAYDNAPPNTEATEDGTDEE